MEQITLDQVKTAHQTTMLQMAVDALQGLIEHTNEGVMFSPKENQVITEVAMACWAINNKLDEHGWVKEDALPSNEGALPLELFVRKRKNQEEE